jgi:phage-related protein
MIEIKDLLGRFKELLSNEDYKKEAVRDTLKNILNLDIEKEKITIKKNSILLDINPVYKNEVFIKKDIILTSIFEKLGKKNMEIK